MLLFLVPILFTVTSVLGADFDPKAVNLQLEASLLIDPGDMFKDKTVIKSAKNIINALRNNIVLRADDFENQNEDYGDEMEANLLNKFLTDLSDELLHYKEEALKDLADVLYEKVNEYYQRGPYNPVLYNKKVKYFVMRRLKDLSNTNPAQLKIITRRFASNPKRKAIAVNNLNKFFNSDDTETFDKIIRDLHANSKSIDKSKIRTTIEEALEFLILDRYKNMNKADKERFSKEIYKLVDQKPTDDINIIDFLKKVLDNAFRNYIAGLLPNATLIEKLTHEKVNAKNENLEQNEISTKRNIARNGKDSDNENWHSKNVKNKNEFPSTPYSEFYK